MIVQLTHKQPRADACEEFAKAAEAARKCSESLRQFGLAASLIKFKRGKK